ncbi:Dyp-type peroxidase family [Sphingomonas laterariae]|uniref:Dyp-type peroxidase family n=1 Tax=Edaphosphingomonas laterariae TaxID=861865 RepID=A0A239CDG0_9SPHN|nr:Dyp-type peroxidase domain-containing protein [Sphingomonas laterariae]SNS17999.1 Dyp-type peroxidase family [Sphingomonas laterariae]
MGKPFESKHLEGISDLFVCAEIKPGFIDSFADVTYETRLRTTLEALFRIRKTSREYYTLKPFVEATERIRSIRSFRLAILDTEPRRLLLAATFDRGWEPYIRLIWRPLGSLLDLIFCNCQGYVTAEDHSFDEYAAWVRDSQIDTGFFFASTGLTVDDFAYLTEMEQVAREEHDPVRREWRLATATAERPEARAKADLQRGAANPQTDGRVITQMGIELLISLYHLADHYPPDQMDAHGKYLLRAAQSLLGPWGQTAIPALPAPIRDRLQAQIAWLNLTPPAPPVPVPDRLAIRPEQIQAGILSGHDEGRACMTHGALLLLQVVDAAKARAFVDRLADEVDSEATAKPDGAIWQTAAFTFNGLGRLGVAEAALARFPREFREGMEDRADLLGDVHAAHPRNWQLPPRWPEAGAAAPVELAEVDIVIQLRTHSAHAGHEIVGDAAHPLAGRIAELAAQVGQTGVRLLAVQPMRRAAAIADPLREHFGFRDGLSQPWIAGAGPAGAARDRVAAGEILCGHVNDRGDAAPPPPDAYLDNGTFLVVRKLRQNVAALDALVAARPAGMDGDLFRAKLMGRWPDGRALTGQISGDGNDYDFAGDEQGAVCPLQAHARRANPRAPDNSQMPRILRRGMSYGPPAKSAAKGDRGIVFMAYNSSIAEQFEVIQRWISGGNSTGIATARHDPLIGVRAGGDPQTFHFLDDHGGTVRADVGAHGPMVELQWGLYLFMPAIPAMRAIAAAGPPPRARTGQDLIERLQALPEAERFTAWRTCLEDFYSKDPGKKGDGPAIWAAVRDLHGGVLRTPFGVLVGSRALVDEVYVDRHGRYTVAGYGERMAASFGMIFLGNDRGAAYDVEAGPTNAAIMKIGEDEAFADAYGAASGLLDGMVEASLALGLGAEARFDIQREYIDAVLAMLSHRWFGIPDAEGRYVEPGAWDWRDVATRKPRCPGDFMATSRSVFYPHPPAATIAYGKAQGQAERRAVRDFVAAMRGTPERLTAPISRAIFDAFPDDDDLVARTIVGVMTGFLPPTEGNLRWAFYDWIDGKTIWRVQQAYLMQPGATPLERARGALLRPLCRAMQQRPAPDMVWRRAKKAHRLGKVAIKRDDLIVIGIVSATAEDMAAGGHDVYPVFGGNRHDTGHGTHACPAYAFAMGTMLGILAALFDAGRITLQPSPLVLKVSRLA